MCNHLKKYFVEIMKYLIKVFSLPYYKLWASKEELKQKLTAEELFSRTSLKNCAKKPKLLLFL